MAAAARRGAACRRLASRARGRRAFGSAMAGARRTVGALLRLHLFLHLHHLLLLERLRHAGAELEGVELEAQSVAAGEAGVARDRAGHMGPRRQPEDVAAAAA